MVRPCEYYSSPSPERVLPEWAPWGCGAVSVLVLIVLFAGGAYLAGGGLLDLMELDLGMKMGKIRGMYAADVTPALKSSLEAEVTTMRRLLRERKISMQSLQAVMEAIGKTTADEKLSAAEVRRIIDAVRKVNVQVRAQIPLHPPGRPAAGNQPSR